jgi:hypothetical protein
MTKRPDPSSQGWGSFLRNHAPHIAAMDLFVVPTIGFNLLYVLVIIRLARRELVWINVTPHPVCTENLDSDVLVMQTADQGMRHDATDLLNRARDRRIFVQ